MQDDAQIAEVHQPYFVQTLSERTLHKSTTPNKPAFDWKEISEIKVKIDVKSLHNSKVRDVHELAIMLKVS